MFIFRFCREYWMEAAFMNLKRFMAKESLLASLGYMGKVTYSIFVI